MTDTLFDLPVVGGRNALQRAGLEKVTPPGVIETPQNEPDADVPAGDLRDG